MTRNFGPALTRRNHRRLILARIVALAALIGLGASPAHAQTAPGQPVPPPNPLAGIEVLVTPYVWGTWMDVGINPSNTRIPSASGTVGFDQIVKHLSWVPFMGEVEFRDGPYGILLDYLHAPLRAGIDTRNILFGGGTGGVVLDTGTAMFLYRPIALPDQYLDVGLGVRAWGISGDVALNEGLLPSFDVSRGTSWADPLIGVRYHHELGNGFGATAYGDVGGFGLGAHIDWQLIGTIDYAVNSWIDLHAGFRSLNFTYGLPRAGADVGMNGPLIAATFRF